MHSSLVVSNSSRPSILVHTVLYSVSFALCQCNSSVSLLVNQITKLQLSTLLDTHTHYTKQLCLCFSYFICKQTECIANVESAANRGREGEGEKEKKNEEKYRINRMSFAYCNCSSSSQDFATVWV